ncbi:hypothetical protein [Acanthopleuribacter pedis]|uniref:Uncharacterized protein n=1 Tax=Acanthopleuribacter pedis TaxID=442870 RepID=A0A8J7QLV3_9BACT|nr:hypothetical protein [Acanthopleuribacter pedis]MBO1320350.1 hypothetical protein [Acanthopleuribacter pedis]
MTHVFDKEEQTLIPINPDWSAETLLRQKGMIRVVNLVELLPVTSREIRREHDKLAAEGRDPYRVMGVRKVLGAWYLRMSVFAPYYRAHLVPIFRSVNPTWDKNTLLEQDGVFLLSDIQHITPFSGHQLRYQARRLAKPRETMGVYKDPELNRYLVEMPAFRRWLFKLWAGDNPRPPDQNPSETETP